MQKRKVGREREERISVVLRLEYLCLSVFSVSL